MNIFVTDLKGEEHQLTGTLNWTVMEIIRDGDLPMRAECGGCTACATCHVHVDPAWIDRVGRAEGEELATLDGGFNIEPNSRLSCQITLTPDLDGLKVTLTEDCAG